MSRQVKASALICALILIVACVTVPAYAVSFDILYPDDFICETSQSDGIIYTRYELAYRPAYYLYPNGSNGKYYGGDFVYEPPSDVSSLVMRSFPLGTYLTSGEPAKGYVIDLHDYKENSVLSLTCDAYVVVDYEYAYTGSGPDNTAFYSGTMFLFFYDEWGNFLSLSTSADEKHYVYDVNNGGKFSLFSKSIDLNIPNNAAYMVPTIRCNFNFPTGPAILKSVSSFTEAFTIKTSVDSVIDGSETMHRIENKLDDTNDKLDEIIQQPEQEKQEAGATGESAVEDFISAIPDESQGFMNALLRLQEIFSYEGTDATLTFPALTLPEIPGVMNSYRLSEEYEVDFEFWASKIPDNVMTAVQCILTLALIAYCYKELYDVISYAVTLKGGD